MDEDFLRHQLELASPRQSTSATLHILATCWPGGTADRAEPVALGWLRRWSPATANLGLPTCSCACGPCPLCN